MSTSKKAPRPAARKRQAKRKPVTRRKPTKAPTVSPQISEEAQELSDELSFYDQLHERILRIDSFVNTVRRSLRYRYSPTDIEDMEDESGSNQFGSMLEEIKLLSEAGQQLRDLYNFVDKEEMTEHSGRKADDEDEDDNVEDTP